MAILNSVSYRRGCGEALEDPPGGLVPALWRNSVHFQQGYFDNWK